MCAILFIVAFVHRWLIPHVRCQGVWILLTKILQCVGRVHLLRPTSLKHRIYQCAHILGLAVILSNLTHVYSNYLFIYRFITSVVWV